MEAFSLLKYWRNGASPYTPRSASASTTTFVTAVSHHSDQTDDDNDDEEGPFFDLEFSVPDDEKEGLQAEENDCGFSGDEEKVEDSDSECSVGEDGREMNFTLSSASSGDSIDPNVSLSPSDDLFFKGRLLPIEPSSESNSKSQFPVSLVKSATKFRVLMLKLKKSKSNVPRKTECNGSEAGNKDHSIQQAEKKLTVMFKVEEVPIVSSLFSRENSSKVGNGKAQKQYDNAEESVSEEKRFSKDVMQRYLKKVRPFYVRTSKRYGEKIRLSGQFKVAGAANAEMSLLPCSAAKIEAEAVNSSILPMPGSAKSQKIGNLPAGLREVYKHLGKSRSASSSVAAVPNATVVSKRRDDSLLQQQDGIQSAILHCKRSFKASRDSECRSISEKETQESG